MLTSLQQTTVWEGWLSAEIRANYFADLSTRYRRHQRTATWLTLFSSSGAAATVIGTWGIPWAPLVLSLITAGLSLYSLVAQDQQRAADSADLHWRWNQLASDYRTLWDDMYAADAATRLSVLEAREQELSKAGTAFPYKKRLMERWETHVLQQHHLSAHAA